MDQIQVYSLGADGLTFFTGELQKAGPIASSVAPQFGKIWSYLPQSAEEKRTLLYLRDGGAFSAEQAHDILQHALKFISNFLLESPLNVLLCEDRFFAINDPPNQHEQLIFDYAGVTYHYMSSSGGSIDTSEIEEVVGCASTYPLILILTKTPSGRQLPERAKVEGDLADELKRNVKHVIQGAFDEEGYVIWSQPGSLGFPI